MIISYWKLLSYFTVLIPLLTAILVVRKISKEYYFFLYFIFLIGICDLTLAFLHSLFPKSYARVYVLNINILIESLILLLIYNRFALFKNNKKLLLLFFICFIIAWICETIFFSNFRHANNYFVFYYNFVAGMLTIKMINNVAEASKIPLYQNPKFILCAGFIVYYFGEIIPGIFLLSFFKASISFKTQLVYIADVAVTLMYLFFTYALILIGKEPCDKRFVVRAPILLRED
jgi:hypothetical protein